MSLTCAVKDCSNSAYWLNKWKKQLCSVCGCLHKKDFCRCDPPFRLFTFPTKKKDHEQRERWKQLIARKTGNKLWSPLKDSRVCITHFVDSMPTRQNPLPTLNLGYNGFEARVKRILFFKQEKSCTYHTMEGDCTLGATAEQPVDHPDPPLELATPCPYWCPWPVILLLVVMCLIGLGRSLSKTLQTLMEENERLRSEIRKLRSQKHVENILRSDSDVNFYTGFKSRSLFEKMHSFVSPLVNRRWLGVRSLHGNIRRFHKEPRRFNISS